MVNNLNSKSSEIEEKLTELDDRVSQLKDSASATVVESNSKIEAYAETFESSSKEELSNFLSAQEGKIEALVVKHEGLFTELASEKKLEIEEMSSSRDEEMRELLTSQQQELESRQNEASEILGILRETLADSELKLKGINENYGLSGEKVLTGTYSSQKDIERRHANTWRWIGFGLLCASVIIAVLLNFDAEVTEEGTKYSLRKYESGWGYLSKYGLILTLLLPGLIALRESAAHRNRANRYVQLEAQLAALDPFIQSFNHKEDFKSELKEAFFPGYSHEGKSKKRKKRKRKSLFANLSANKTSIDALRNDLEGTQKELGAATANLKKALEEIVELRSQLSLED